MKEKQNYFFCYNKNVSKFLYQEGIEFITVAKDMRSQKVFSLYLITKELQKALDKYKSK